jgi:hypothetical protein
MGYLDFKEFVKQNTEGFDFGNEQHELFLKNIVNYFCGKTTTLDPKKGLMVQGGIGSGKTSILKLIQIWLPQSERFMYNPVQNVVSDYNAGGDEVIDVYKKKKERLFDDLGTERIGKYYGNNVETLQEIIMSRYDLYRYQNVKTHFTTNLENNFILERYGERAFDRLKEMCNLIVWNKQDSFRGKKEFTIIKKDETKMTTEPTQLEKEEIRTEYLQNCFIIPFEKYTSTGLNTFNDNDCVYFFWQLYQRKLLTPSPEESAEYRERAKKIIDNDKRVLAKDKNDLKRLISNLQEGNVDQMEKDVRIAVKEKAAVLFFLDWCKAFANCDVSIKEFLTENEFYKV